MMPTVAVELHVLQVRFLRALLHRVDRERVLQGLEVRVSEQRVVVDGHLRVERDDRAVLELDQRVDLHEGRVGAPRPRATSRAGPPPRRRARRRAATPTSSRRCHGAKPEPGFTWTRRSASGRSRASVSMSIPPSAVSIHRYSPDGAVEQHRRVELVRDRQQLLHEDPRDRVALEVGAEHAAGGLARLGAGPAQGHAAALAAAADLDLDLDHRATAELVGRRCRLIGGLGHDAARRRDAMGAEQVLAHVLVEIHRPSGTGNRANARGVYPTPP